jgi:hypothetical protein
MKPNDLTAELEEYGFVVLRELIPKADAQRIAQRVQEIMRRHVDKGQPDLHLSGLYDYLEPGDYPLFDPLFTQPACLEAASHLLGDGFQMTEVGCRWRKPSAPAGPMHPTKPLDRFVAAGLPLPNVCFVLAISWMINDLTRDMGATLYLPCSHHLRHVPRGGLSDKYLVPIEAPAGSVVIHHSGLWHRFGPNTTRDQARVGVMSGYIPAWLDPQTVGWKLMKRSVRDRLSSGIQHLNHRAVED